jgi:alkylated DNA repair dioxygenase AlkB
MRIELPYGQHMVYVADAFSAITASRQEKQIMDEVTILYHPNPMNKSTRLKRGNAWFSDDPSFIYRYSGMTNNPVPFPPVLAEIRDVLQERFEPRLNCCLLNYYPDGSVGVAPHTDDDFPRCGADVVGVSYGASRIFRLTDRRTKETVHDITLEHGSVLVMTDESQAHFKHEIVKESKTAGARLQLSWRAWAG